MGIATYDKREKQTELREKLLEIEGLRKAGRKDYSAHIVSIEIREMLKKKSKDRSEL